MEAALSLPATLVAKLIEDAERQGMSVDEYCRAILSESRAGDRPSTQAAFVNEPSLDDLKLEQLSVERLSQTAVGRTFGKWRPVGPHQQTVTSENWLSGIVVFAQR